MIAYKVESYGRYKFYPIITKREIHKFTKTRVYFKSSSYDFENIQVHDLTFPHMWFKNRKDAIAFCIKTLKAKINKLELNIKEAKKSLNHYKSVTKEK